MVSKNLSELPLPMGAMQTKAREFTRRGSSKDWKREKVHLVQRGGSE
jgi:hypothetical protein